MAQQMELFWASGSCPSWRVQICLAEKGLDGYTTTMLNMGKGEHKSPEMLALNPRGQVPVFTDGEVVVSDSGATCAYLEEVYKSRGVQLIPGGDGAPSLASKALVLQRTHETGNLYGMVTGIVKYFFFLPKEKQDEETIKQKKADARDELRRWEDYLAKQNSRYMAGNDFTMADVATFPCFAFFVRMGFDLGGSGCPLLQRYYDELKTRPSVANNWPPHWKTSSNSNILSD